MNADYAKEIQHRSVHISIFLDDSTGGGKPWRSIQGSRKHLCRKRLISTCRIRRMIYQYILGWGLIQMKIACGI